ncbi:MAG: GNAT family N-acetyltransferase, partial [Verrucomicrobiae bacterium]|nr:GNAT family N-acetyltransferase [Verrucomicrobiae bacterium]
KDRMRSAIERAKRGNLLLTIRRKETGQIVHFSWLRVDEKGVQGDFALCPLPDANPAGVIFDCWTSPDCRGQGLYPWAIRRLAAEAHSKGLRPWIYCYEDNVSSKKGIEKAGIVSTTILSGRVKP